MRSSQPISALAVVATTVLVACAARPKAAESAPTATPRGDAASAVAAPSTGAQAGYPSSSGASDAKAPAPPPPSTPPAQDSTSTYAPPPNRSAALHQASNDVEASQRELDVAGGDCRNACRALGSMDRAAGRLCGLAQSNDEVRRCGEAKTRVYSARDKVRNTCGTCPDVAVERSAPIPSR